MIVLYEWKLSNVIASNLQGPIFLGELRSEPENSKSSQLILSPTLLTQHLTSCTESNRSSCGTTPLHKSASAAAPRLYSNNIVATTNSPPPEGRVEEEEEQEARGSLPREHQRKALLFPPWSHESEADLSTPSKK